ncbi:hypothetical protein CsSME_00052556 [Camellia sinensis var. sinensis]
MILPISELLIDEGGQLLLVIPFFGWFFNLASFFQLNNTHYWERLRSCLLISDDCNNLSKKYKLSTSLILSLLLNNYILVSLSLSLTHYFLFLFFWVSIPY